MSVSQGVHVSPGVRLHPRRHSQRHLSSINRALSGGGVVHGAHPVARSYPGLHTYGHRTSECVSPSCCSTEPVYSKCVPCTAPVDGRLAQAIHAGSLSVPAEQNGRYCPAVSHATRHEGQELLLRSCLRRVALSSACVCACLCARVHACALIGCWARAR
eukprot:424718-Rhodomonas_salina.1